MEFVPSDTLTVTFPEIPEVASEHVPETTYAVLLELFTQVGADVIAIDGLTVSLPLVTEVEPVLPAASLTEADTVRLLVPSEKAPGVEAVVSSVTEYVPLEHGEVPDLELVPSEILTVTLPEIPDVASEHVPETV